MMETPKDIRSCTMTELIGKPAAEFTRADIMKFAEQHDIRMLNFIYPAADGRLKTLNFVAQDKTYLETVLTHGERVDGSSLFPFIEAGSSDLYVIPRYHTAFIDPFAEQPTIDFLCAFVTKDGERLESSPEYILHKAATVFREKTGMEYEAMGELEYYVSAPLDADLEMYPATSQRGYHESSPFAKFNDFRTECMYYISLIGGEIKYGHSEVGNFTLDGRIYEQNEIEFLPTKVEAAADQLMLAKWVIRNMAYQRGLDVSFAPKITEGKAGSGLHVHMKITKNGTSQMLDSEGRLSDTARKAIAGMMTLAPSITSFGNANPTSYFRLVPHQEAPTNICWGDRNRSVLVRVPLGWTSGKDMSALVNPLETPTVRDTSSKQTVEIRSADGSADIYMLLAALCVACRSGLEMDGALDIAERTYVDIDIHKSENKAKADALSQLPDSCHASAAQLEQQRSYYEKYGIFNAGTIDSIIAKLRSFDDGDIRTRISQSPSLMKELVTEYYYCG
jgi:glutamine synthetase